jgi:Mitotic checkpoint regulator, MAD2B-interacting
MVLVGYSDSEGSDEETSKTNEGSYPKKDPASKRGFQKVVDRSNPSKIRVNLPDAPSAKRNGTSEESEEPPAKKTRLGGGGLSGFNAMLPAPKAVAPAAPAGAGSRSGLKRGVSLKTGAAPGFTREPMPLEKEEGDNEVRGEVDTPAEDDVDNIPKPNDHATPTPPNSVDIKPKGKATMFKPLSVARKPQKPKKKVEAPADRSQPVADNTASSSPPKSKPKVSLFSTHTEAEQPVLSTSTNSYYQPTLYQAGDGGAGDDAMDDTAATNASASLTDVTSSQAGSQSLDTVASELDLSAADRRRLFGRGGKGVGVNVTTFSTDAEYAANEVFRANQDQQEVRNPVRAIAPGKHSLRQLVNAAVGQKDALEEQFATGRRNKKEASGKYGW